MVGAVTALLSPGTGNELSRSQGLRVPAVAVRSGPGQDEKPVLVLDLCLVSAGL